MVSIVSYSRFQPGEGPSRGLLRVNEPSDGTFSSTRTGASLQLTNTPLINSDSNFISQSFVVILITKLNNFSNCQFNWIDVTRYRLRLCWCYRCLIRTLTLLFPSLNVLSIEYRFACICLYLKDIILMS